MSPLFFHTPSDSSSEDTSSKTFAMPAHYPPTPPEFSPSGSHSNITMEEWDSLCTQVHKKRPVYVDTDYLNLAGVAAVSR